MWKLQLRQCFTNSQISRKDPQQSSTPSSNLHLDMSTTECSMRLYPTLSLPFFLPVKCAYCTDVHWSLPHTLTPHPQKGDPGKWICSKVLKLDTNMDPGQCKSPLADRSPASWDPYLLSARPFNRMELCLLWPPCSNHCTRWTQKLEAWYSRPQPARKSLVSMMEYSSQKWQLAADALSRVFLVFSLLSLLI